MKTFKELNINTHPDLMIGEKVKISKVLNQEILITNYRIVESKYPKNKSGKCLHLQFKLGDEFKILFTGSDVLIHTIEQVKTEDLPVTCQIIQEGEHYEFK